MNTIHQVIYIEHNEAEHDNLVQAQPFSDRDAAEEYFFSAVFSVINAVLEDNPELNINDFSECLNIENFTFSFYTAENDSVKIYIYSKNIDN